MCAYKNLNSARMYKLSSPSNFPAKSITVSDNKDSEVSKGI